MLYIVIHHQGIIQVKKVATKYYQRLKILRMYDPKLVSVHLQCKEIGMDFCYWQRNTIVHLFFTFVSKIAFKMQCRLNHHKMYVLSIFGTIHSMHVVLKTLEGSQLSYYNKTCYLDANLFNQ